MFVIRDGKKIAKRGNPDTLFRRHLDVGMSLTSPPNGPELCRAGTFFLRGSFVFGTATELRERRGRSEWNEIVLIGGGWT
jgi:hypothetical protein